MRAGQFDRTIQLQVFSAWLNDYGTPTESWSDLVTLRAQRVQASTEEYLRGYGETDATVVIFRTRWIEGVTNEHRVVCEGQAFNVREVKEIGRRKGLELRCEMVRS